jgi:tRNA dimethylallyltransferase
MNTTHSIIVICGPTASGKTGLALQLAKELPKANILSVDSRQVYKGLDIITGKDIPEGLSPNIKIYGHDIFDPTERANLADFVRFSQKIIATSQNTGTPLIIVGGTGLYLKAITQNLSDVTVPLNQKLRKKLETLSLEKLQYLLQKENPQKYSSLNHSDFMNPRRLIRYIEISKSHSRPDRESISSSLRVSPPLAGGGTPTRQSPTNFHWIGLLPDKTTLKQNIHTRVMQRLKSGAIDEVKNLLKNHSDRNLPIYTSLGVSFIIDCLDQKISKEQLIDLWTNAEADYARRQVVWFKKQPSIVWYDKDIDKQKLVCELSKIYLKNA